MLEQLQSLLQVLVEIPPAGVYVLVGLGTAVENIFPPVPSDTVVLLGALLSEWRVVEYPGVFAVAWIGNVSTALAVYGAARRYGRGIFETRWGQRVLRPHQLNRLSAFYERYGTGTVFLSRFVPVFRVLVPVFAGISGLGFWRTAVPVGLASALWYAVLLAGGGLAVRNLPRLAELAARANWTLWVVAGVVGLAVGIWWWQTRSDEADDPEGMEGEWPRSPGDPTDPSSP